MSMHRRSRVHVVDPSTRNSFEMNFLSDDELLTDEVVPGSNVRFNTHTVRRTQSLHKNALLNRDPKRQFPSKHIAHYATIRGTFSPDEVDSPQSSYILDPVEQLLNQIEQNDNLMQDTPDSEARRIETVRDIAQSISVKRNIRVKLSASVSRKSKRRPIGCCKLMMYRFSFWWQRMKLNSRDLLFSMDLWYKSIKTIEGHFGSGVGTYFSFLRSLFIMNLLISIITTSFVVIPQAIQLKHDNSTVDTGFKFWDIFTGQGYLTNSSLFYGFYTDSVLNMNDRHAYNLSYAYILSMLFVYLAVFVFISFRMERSYRTNYIKTSIGLKNRYASRIFCCWDFSIATAEAATLKHKSFYNEIKELLSDCNTPSSSSCLAKCYSYSIKIIMHLFVLSILVATAFMMYYLLEKNIDYDAKSQTTTIHDGSILVTLVITLIMFVCPVLFTYIVRFEQYSNPRTALYVTLFRTFTLHIVIISILWAFWLKARGFCKETAFAQEIYRLIVFDFFISLLLVPVLGYAKKTLHKYFSSNVGCQKFDIANNTLSLIYNQTLLWTGLFFSPLLSVIVTVKLFLLFYLNKFTLCDGCKPSSKPWKAAQMHTVFLFLIFFSLLCIILGLGYTMISVPTGKCGPFQNEPYVFWTLLSILNIKENNKILNAISYFIKPGFTAIILIAMCVTVYFMRAKSINKKRRVVDLRKFLGAQSKDKDFLLKAIKNVSEGKWIYDLKDDASPEVDDSNVVRTPCNANYKLNQLGRFRIVPSNNWNGDNSSIGE